MITALRAEAITYKIRELLTAVLDISSKAVFWTAILLEKVAAIETNQLTPMEAQNVSE